MNLKVNFDCEWVDDIEDYETLINFLTTLKLQEIKRQEILNEKPKRKRKKKNDILELDDNLSVEENKEEMKDITEEDNFVECITKNIVPSDIASTVFFNAYEKMNVKQLRELCKEKGLSGYSKLTRENLILKLKDVKENEP